MTWRPVPGPRRIRRAENLFDLLADHDTGMTIAEMAAHLGVSSPLIRNAVYDLRRILGETHTANLVCTQHVNNEQWIYRLSGDVAGVKAWQANRLGDAVTRIETIHAIAKSVAAAHKGQSAQESRIAVALVKSLGRAIEDVADIKSEVDV